MNPRILLASAFLLAAAVHSGPMHGGVVHLSQSNRPSFEVASIKLNQLGGRIGTATRNGSFSGTNQTLIQLVTYAYRVREFQIFGGPGWTSVDRFDVEARAAAGTPTPDADDPDRPGIIALMVQSLLADRFQLKLHRETRNLPVYEMLVNKTSKLTPTVEGKPGPGGLKAGQARLGGSNGNVELIGSGLSVSFLARLLSQQLGRPVIDKTKIEGDFDFTLVWARSSVDLTSTSDTSGPSLFTAIQEQLGLKLESTTGPVDVIVIDSVQKPTPN